MLNSINKKSWFSPWHSWIKSYLLAKYIVDVDWFSYTILIIYLFSDWPISICIWVYKSVSCLLRFLSDSTWNTKILTLRNCLVHPSPGPSQDSSLQIKGLYLQTIIGSGFPDSTWHLNSAFSRNETVFDIKWSFSDNFVFFRETGTRIFLILLKHKRGFFILENCTSLKALMEVREQRVFSCTFSIHQYICYINYVLLPFEEPIYKKFQANDFRELTIFYTL